MPRFKPHMFLNFLIRAAKIIPNHPDKLDSDSEGDWTVTLSPLVNRMPHLHGLGVHVMDLLYDHDAIPQSILGHGGLSQNIAQHLQFMIWDYSGRPSDTPIARMRSRSDRHEGTFYKAPVGSTLYIASSPRSPAAFSTDVRLVQESPRATLTGALIIVEHTNGGDYCHAMLEPLQEEGLFAMSMARQDVLVEHSRELIRAKKHPWYNLAVEQARLRSG